MLASGGASGGRCAAGFCPGARSFAKSPLLRHLLNLALLCLCLVWSQAALARTPIHTVRSGDTLGGIAKRYKITIDALCHANAISRTKPIRLKQQLRIPAPDDEGGKRARAERDRERAAEKDKDTDKKGAAKPQEKPAQAAAPSGVQVLELPGAGPLYYHEPTGPGRKNMRPVILYLHARGGSPKSDCQRWARVASDLGWVACPTGPEDRGGGKRGWDNTWYPGSQIAQKSIDALRAKFGRRVQLYGNTLVGFSEGAFVAMNVGVRQPRTFNRWLILSADTKYWGGPGLTELGKNHRQIRKVQLITGQDDGTHDATLTVERWLKQAKVSVRAITPAGMGHVLELEGRRALYRSALVWLNQ